MTFDTLINMVTYIVGGIWVTIGVTLIALPMGFALGLAQTVSALGVFSTEIAPNVFLSYGIGLFRQNARDAAESGRAVIYTTQLVDLAVGFSDRVCVLHQGRVYEFVPPEKLQAMADNGDEVIRKLLGTRGKSR